MKTTRVFVAGLLALAACSGRTTGAPSGSNEPSSVGAPAPTSPNPSSTVADVTAARAQCAAIAQRQDAGTSDHPSTAGAYRERLAGAWLLCPSPGNAGGPVSFTADGRWSNLKEDGTGALVDDPIAQGTYAFGCYAAGGGALVQDPAASAVVDECTLDLVFASGEGSGGYIAFETAPHLFLLTGGEYRVYVSLGGR
jgi:hypothetical protein